MPSKQFNSKLLLQLFLGVALIVYGIMAINGYNSTGQELVRGFNKMFGRSNNMFPIIFGIVELAAGIVLIVELFISLSAGLFKIIHLVICLFWLVNIAVNFFMSNFLEPDAIRWLGALIPQLIILISLWIVGEER